MRSPKQYEDGAFLERFCQYDDRNVAEKVCRHVIKGEKVYEEFQTAQNGRENVLIYAGSLVRNGLTTALLNLLANIDVEKRNYYLSFRSSNLAKNPERVSQIPENLGFIPIANMKFKSLGEAVATYLYFKKDCTGSLVVKRWIAFTAECIREVSAGVILRLSYIMPDTIRILLTCFSMRLQGG